MKKLIEYQNYIQTCKYKQTFQYIFDFWGEQSYNTDRKYILYVVQERLPTLRSVLDEMTKEKTKQWGMFNKTI